MLRRLCVLLALLIALCACAASAEPAGLEGADAAPSAPDPHGLEDRLVGEWLVEYVSVNGMMMSTAQYALRITLTLNPDGSVIMDYNGEIDDGMSWFAEADRAYLSGYNDAADVEIDVRDYGLIIADEIGTLYLSRGDA